MLPPARPQPLRQDSSRAWGQRGRKGRALSSLAPRQHTHSAPLLYFSSHIKPPQLGRRGWKVPEVAWPSPPQGFTTRLHSPPPQNRYISLRKQNKAMCFRAVSFQPPLTFTTVPGRGGGPCPRAVAPEHRAWHRATRGRPSLKVGGPGIPGVSQGSSAQSLWASRQERRPHPPAPNAP